MVTVVPNVVVCNKSAIRSYLGKSVFVDNGCYITCYIIVQKRKGESGT